MGSGTRSMGGMVMPLPAFNQLKTGEQSLDDAQRAIADLSKALQSGALGSPNFITTVFESPLAAAAANATIPIMAARIKVKLVAVRVTAVTAIAAAGANFRTYSVLRYRNNVLVATMATRNTTVASVSALVPFEITLGFGDDMIADIDDVIVLSLGGGGVQPLADGAVTLEWEPQ